METGSSIALHTHGGVQLPNQRSGFKVGQVVEVDTSDRIELSSTGILRAVGKILAITEGSPTRYRVRLLIYGRERTAELEVESDRLDPPLPAP